MSWVGWAILSALFAAITAILAKLGVEHVDSNLATAIRTSVVVIAAWAVAYATHRRGALSTLDGRTLAFLGASGIATTLSWLCYFRALSLGPASRVAPLDKLSVVFVLLFAWPILGERPGLTTVFGGFLLTSGAIILTFTR